MIYQCKKCNKIYRSDYWLKINNGGHIFGPDVCGGCGSVNEMQQIPARPKLFGLLGWEVAVYSLPDNIEDVIIKEYNAES